MAKADTLNQKGHDNSIFLVLHTALRQQNGKLFVEPPTANGMDRWAENFSQVTLACPVIPEDLNPSGYDNWRDVATLEHHDRIHVIPLPRAYTLGTFLRTYRATRKLLADNIRTHRYLQFAIGGLIGDWASVAAYQAHKQKRPYAVWTDRVEHQVIKQSYNDNFKRKLRNFIQLPIMKHLELDVVRKSAVGLFHGNETYQAYSPLNPNSYLVHNIHIKPQHLISDQALAEKLARIEAGEPLKIAYSGRLDPMKAPLDWQNVLKQLDDAKIDFSAVWMGSGVLQEAMEKQIQQDGLTDKIHLPGFMDHEEVLKNIRESDIFLFTHVTPESPRCLIEALVSGTPIVGYGSAYPEDLIAKNGGGIMTEINHKDQLAQALKNLHEDRDKLATLVKNAALDGKPFNDTAVFQHRSELIKKHLP